MGHPWERGHVVPALVADVILHARIAETMLWCESLASLADCRPTQLRQNLLHDGPDDLVCSIGNDRRNAARSRKLPTWRQPPFGLAGRFMLHFPDENLTDGAAELASDGFFDVFNVPPVDTWVSWFVEEGRPLVERRYLLCYVPSWALLSARAGIEVNPEACIVWLDESDVAIRLRVEAFAKLPP